MSRNTVKIGSKGGKATIRTFTSLFLCILYAMIPTEIHGAVATTRLTTAEKSTIIQEILK